MNRWFFLCIVFLTAFCVVDACEQKPQAAISFLCADMKYSKKNGIKICEFQQGVHSGFAGYDWLYDDKKHVQKCFVDILCKYKQKIWFLERSVPEIDIQRLLKEKGARGYFQVQELLQDPEFLEAARTEVENLASLSSYHGILLASPRLLEIVPDFQEQYPGILICDIATYPYWADKYKLSQLFQGDPFLEQRKPKWKAYPKIYSPDLHEQIAKDIPGNIVVIKPRSAFKGSGVIMTTKENLNKILEDIIAFPQLLPTSEDTTFVYWKRDRQESFIVEEFYQSDTIFPESFGGKPYDATVRVSFTISLDNGQIGLDLFDCHWNIPKSSLEDESSLTLKHKSFWEIPHFAKVSEELKQEIKKELEEVFGRIYKKITDFEEKDNSDSLCALHHA